MSAGTVVTELQREGAGARGRAQALAGPIAIVVGLTALAAALRFGRLAHQGFWFDEANTAQLVHFSFGTMLGRIPHAESTPPLYYALAWGWARVFGYGEAGLRSLSALAGVATVPVAYAACAKLITRRAGVVAAALTACNPFLIWYSQEARSYELLVLFAACSLCAFAYVRDEPTPRWLAAWLIASALALATHYYAILVLIPEALWLLAVHRRRREVQITVALLGVCGLALIPLAISQHGTGKANWIGQASLSLRLGQIPQHFLVGTGAPAAGWLKLSAGLAVVLALLLLARRAEPVQRSGALAAGALVGGGLVLILVLVAGGIDDLITRNVIVLWLPALFVLAGGFGARRAGPLGLLGAAVLCGVGIVAAVGVAVDRKLERPDWRLVARAVGPPPATGAPGVGRAILIQHQGTLLPMSLYLRGLQRVHRPGALVSELDVIAISTPYDPFCWWGAACNPYPSKLPSTLRIAGFHVAGPVERINQFSLLRLRASTPTLLTPRAVARSLTTTTFGRDELLVVPPA